MEDSGNRKQRQVHQYTDYGTKCIFSDSRCDAAAKKIGMYNKHRNKYYIFPKKPKDDAVLSDRYFPSEEKVAAQKIKIKTYN